MDSLITAAALALGAGDALGALNHIALRDDAPALALRGIAMAQLGDLARARLLLRRAARAFGSHEAVHRARCVVAEAEIALVSRELTWPGKALSSARATLDAHGDHANAAHARYLEVRQLLLTGKLDEAELAIADLDQSPLPLASRAAFELVVAGIAMRRVRARQARSALARAAFAARHARIPALMAEIERCQAELEAPVARLFHQGDERLMRLADVEDCFASEALVVDGLRHAVREGTTVITLDRRPVLFALIRQLALAWPGDVSRTTIIASVFRAKHIDETHRARLRVEIGRLRTELATVAQIVATPRGFALAPQRAGDVVVLALPADEPHSAVLALLGDGECWSSSALALALETSQRSVQRALDALAVAGKAHPIGRGRARRWMAPPATGFPTALLLPAILPGR